MKYKYAFAVMWTIYILKLVISILLSLFYLYMLFISFFALILSEANFELKSFKYITLWFGSILLSTIIIKKIGVLKIPKDAFMVPIMGYIISVLLKLMLMGII